MRIAAIVLLVLILLGCTVKAEKKVWDGSMNVAGGSPYQFLAVPDSLIGKYEVQAFAVGNAALGKIDQAGPAAVVLMNINRFSNVGDVVDFLDRENYGVCRHRAAAGYWIIKNLYPEADVWFVSGLLEGPNIIVVDFPESLDMNHDWVEMDGEIVEFTGPKDGATYHPYVRVQTKKGESVTFLDSAQITMRAEIDFVE